MISPKRAALLAALAAAARWVFRAIRKQAKEDLGGKCPPEKERD